MVPHILVNICVLNYVRFLDDPNDAPKDYWNKRRMKHIRPDDLSIQTYIKQEMFCNALLCLEVLSAPSFAINSIYYYKLF